MQKNTKYSKNFHLRCFVAKKILFQIYALCWCTFYRPKKYGGVPKWTNIRYGLIEIFSALTTLPPNATEAVPDSTDNHLINIKGIHFKC